MRDALGWLTGDALPGLSPAEILGFGSGLLAVWWNTRQRVLTWPAGLVNNAMFLALFLHARLYALAGLQVVFAALACWGWWRWSTDRSPEVTHARPGTLPVLAAGILAGTVGLRFALARWTDSDVPLWDAAATAISLAALYAQSKKHIEAWHLWMLADVVNIPLQLHQRLWLTALLFAVYLALCFRGLAAWRRSLAACDG